MPATTKVEAAQFATRSLHSSSVFAFSINYPWTAALIGSLFRYNSFLLGFVYSHKHPLRSDTGPNLDGALLTSKAAAGRSGFTALL